MKSQGYAKHIASTMSEWIMVIAFELFMLTFVSELKNLHVKTIEVEVLEVPTTVLTGGYKSVATEKLQFHHFSTFPGAQPDSKV